MEVGIFITFFIGLFATFIGTIPFGPINLSVVNLTLKKDKQQGFRFSMGASFTEIVEVAVAIAFGTYIQNFFQSYAWVQIVVILLFFGIGLYYLFVQTRPKLESRSKYKVGPFYKGIIVAFANPQALPFWVFMLTIISQYALIDYTGLSLAFFLFGVFAGKMGALLLFVYLSEYLRNRLEASCKLINRTLGYALIIFGLIQAVKYFTS